MAPTTATITAIGMGVTPETLEEAGHLLMDHRVMGDGMLEFRRCAWFGKFAVIEQVAGFDEVAVFGKLLNRIAAVQQNAFIAVNIGDLGFAGRRRGEAGVEGEDFAFGVELADIEHVRAEGAAVITGKS